MSSTIWTTMLLLTMSNCFYSIQQTKLMSDFKLAQIWKLFLDVSTYILINIFNFFLFPFLFLDSFWYTNELLLYYFSSNLFSLRLYQNSCIFWYVNLLYTTPLHIFMYCKLYTVKNNNFNWLRGQQDFLSSDLLCKVFTCPYYLNIIYIVYRFKSCLVFISLGIKYSVIFIVSVLKS